MRVKILAILGSFVLAITIAIASILLYQSPIPVTQVNSLDNLQLPAALQKRLLTEAGSELMLLRYQNNKLEFIYQGFEFNRVYAITRLFEKLAKNSHYELSPGDYLFNLHDGTYEDYGWPVLCFAAVKRFADDKTSVLMPAPEILDLAFKEFFRDIDKKIATYPWDKKAAKIFWRGSLTGSTAANNDILGSDRLRFLNYVQGLNYVDAGLTSYTQQHNPQFLQKVMWLYPLTPGISPGDAQAYKYLIDIDGNSSSYSRMAWILYSNSVLFKHTSDNVQWYYDQMLPLVHYVPVARDFSDLYAQYAWAELHPAEAQEIAKNGRAFAKKTFSQQSILQAAANALQQYQGLIQGHIKNQLL